MERKSIDESMLHIKTRVAVSIVIAIVMATNFATSVLLSISSNSHQIEYANEREKRRINHMKDEMECQIEIDHLKSELKDCKGE